MRYLLFFLCFSVQAQTRYDFSAVSQRIRYWVDLGYYSGAAMAVWKDGKPVYERSFGSYSPETEVYIASAGKWLAAATIAAVVDEGRLSWNDPVSRWLPELNEMKDGATPGRATLGKATLRQLLSHTSGYPDYQPKGRHPDNYQTLKEAVAAIRPLPADTLPGTVFHYGGLAMQVAGRMAELASGKDWEHLFQEKIAGPLGMTHTHFTPVDPTPGHNPMIGGGAKSCLHDYMHFLQMLLNDGTWEGKRVLSVQAIRAMEADQVSPAQVHPGEFVEEARGNTHTGVYGLGVWREQEDISGRAIWLSSPGWAGAYPWIDRHLGVAGFFLTHIDVKRPNPEGFSSFLGSPVLGTMVRRVIGHPEPTGRPALPVRKGIFQGNDKALLYYEIAGNGPPVVLLHGEAFDTRQWEPQFGELARSFTVIRYDLRGYGQSDLPRKKFLHADDLLRLLETLKLQKVHLVGHSTGAVVATDFAALHPERVFSLTVSGGALLPGPGPETPLSPEEKSKQLAEISQWRETRSGRQWLMAERLTHVKQAGKIGTEMSVMIQDWPAWQALHPDFPCFLRSDVLPKLNRLTMPVLVLRGDGEAKKLLADEQTLLRQVSNGREAVLPESGYIPNLEQPEAYTRALLDFLLTEK